MLESFREVSDYLLTGQDSSPHRSDAPGGEGGAQGGEEELARLDAMSADAAAMLQACDNHRAIIDSLLTGGGGGGRGGGRRFEPPTAEVS